MTGIKFGTQSARESDMSKNRRYRAPFVVTTAAAVSSISLFACGGSTDGDNGTGGTGGTSGSGGGGTGGQVQTGGSAGTTGGSAGVGATGGSAGSGATGGSAGSGGTAGSGATGGVGPDGGPICPAEPPGSSFGYKKCPVIGASCQYDVKCQSGTQKFTFNCDKNGYWNVAPQKCALAYDSCPNTDLYCSTQWMIPQGTNPPSPCPTTKPTAGDKCFAGGFGGVWENCGYRCDSSPNSKWTVMSCKYVPNVDSKWESDGACGK